MRRPHRPTHRIWWQPLLAAAALMIGSVPTVAQIAKSPPPPGARALDVIPGERYRADATGILHARHRMVVIPDDTRLGEFREEYAGMLGMLPAPRMTPRMQTSGMSATAVAYGYRSSTECRH